MTVTFNVSGRINRTLEEVFQFHAVNHIENHPKWDDTIKLETITEGPIKVGTLIKRTVSRGGKIAESVMKITEFEPNSAVSTTVNENGIEFSSRVTYEADGIDGMIISTAVEMPDSYENQKEMIVALLNRSLNNIRDLLGE